MSLNIALNNAISGMQLNQQSLAVLSQNIANVNTEGYSRQVINQSAITVDGVGQGVTIDSITRKVDTYLQRAQYAQNGIASSSAVIDDYYQRLQVQLGEPGSQNSIDAYLTGFFNSLQAVASAPDSTSSRSIMVNSANTLATQLSQLAQNVADLRYQADRDIATNVATVNASLLRLNELNANIKRAAGLGQSTAGLLDARDKELKIVTQHMNVTINYDESGSVLVSAANGASLVDVVPNQLRFNAQTSALDFYTDKPMNALTVSAVDSEGNALTGALTLIDGGLSDQITSQITSGTISALQDLRDNILPDVLEQLDQLAGRIRDAVNLVNNEGSGFPPASELTGQRLLNPADISQWTGSIRIAALNADGSPVSPNYANESQTGLRPLTLSFDALNDGGSVNGQVSVQTIINEINNHFGAPPTKTTLGPINNIQLASNTNTLPGSASPSFNFDLDMENISGGDANIFVTGITVLDSSGTNITSVTQGPPGTTLSSAATYQTTAGSADVSIALTSAANLTVGQQIYLGTPSAALVISGIDGIAAADLTGYFTIKSISGNTITVTNASGTLAATGATVADATPASLVTQYDDVATGLKKRTRDSGGQFEVDLSSSPTSSYYDITVSVGVQDASGTISTSNITYRIQNGADNLLNSRYNSTAATGSAVRTVPNTTQATIQAILVDADGNELPKQNGVYLDGEGYLKLVSTRSDVGIAIDSLDSRQLGNGDVSPPLAGSNLGFSSYFALNNFFTSNAIGDTGDTIKGSALNFQVEQRILDNPSLISTGKMVLQRQPTDPSLPPQYTYVQYSGDNTIAQKMAGLNAAIISFSSAGGLPASQTSFQTYVGDVLADISAKSSAATDTNTNAQSLLSGFESRASSISGVNLDDELANTVIFQNAYAATARVISVVGKMYDALIEIV